MNFSDPFIRRPIGTTLLAIGLLLVGVVAYASCRWRACRRSSSRPSASSASRPGADPETMAATVAAPLERRLGEIAGVTEMTSASSLGSTRITVQFDLNRNIDGAARDVQAALNAALTDLPGDLPTLPTLPQGQSGRGAGADPGADLEDDRRRARSTTPPTPSSRSASSQVDGVAEVTVSGAEQPAIRVRVNPARAGRDGHRASRTCARRSPTPTRIGPLGALRRRASAPTPSAPTTSCAPPRDYKPHRRQDRQRQRRAAVATSPAIEQGARNSRSAAWFNRQPAVLLIITKQADANVIETVDRIRELLPEIKRWIPAGIDISVLSDRTETIRASVHDMQLTLARSHRAGDAGGVRVPAARRADASPPASPCRCRSPAPAPLMWCAGFSIDNLSLMALAVSVGFVVDDAIVMIENMLPQPRERACRRCAPRSRARGRSASR